MAGNPLGRPHKLSPPQLQREIRRPPQQLHQPLVKRVMARELLPARRLVLGKLLISLALFTYGFAHFVLSFCHLWTYAQVLAPAHVARAPPLPVWSKVFALLRFCFFVLLLLFCILQSPSCLSVLVYSHFWLFSVSFWRCVQQCLIYAFILLGY